jgi:acyl-CoA thioester hydrolase
MSRRIVDPALVVATRLFRVAKVRVLYDDTDKMGVVYHGSYLRMLEHARVEWIRSLGITYAEMERSGHGLPVTDVGVTYVAPAVYDDLVTLEVGLADLGFSRIRFVYRLSVLAGDRAGLESDLELLRAETRHACITMATGRPTALPDVVHEILARYRETQE